MSTEYSFVADVDKFVLNGAFALATISAANDAIYHAGAASVVFPDPDGNFGEEYYYEFEVNITGGAGTVELEGWWFQFLWIDVDNQGVEVFTTHPDTVAYHQPTSRLSGLSVGKHLIRFSYGGQWRKVRVTNGTITSTRRAIAVAFDNVTGTSLPSATSPIKIWGPRKAAQRGYTSGQYGGYGLIVEFAFNGTDVDFADVGQNSTEGFATSIDESIPQALFSNGDAAVASTNRLLRVTAVSQTPGAHHLRVQCARLGNFKGVRVLNGSRLASASLASATTITVDDGTRFGVGDWIKVGFHGQAEVRQVTGISTNVLTVAALTNAHAQHESVTSWCHPTGSISAHVLTDFSASNAIQVGDSNTQGENVYGETGTPDFNGTFYTTYDNRRAAFTLAATQLAIEPINFGVAGQWASQTTDNATAGDLVNFTAADGSTYDSAFYWLGTNNINGNLSTPTEYQADVQAWVNLAKPNLRAGRRVTLLPVGTPQTTSAKGLSPATILTAMQNVASGDAQVVVATGYLNGLNLTTYNSGSNPTGQIHGVLHYEVSGQDRMANNQIPYFLAAGFTTSGTSGTVTVTRGGGSTFSNAHGTADQITLTASAGTITATAAGGTITNNGTGAVTVKPVDGATSFTYTASVTATITYTNAQNWTNAAATSYTAGGTLPTVTAAETDGTTLTLTFSEGVSGVIANQYTLVSDHTLSSPEGNQGGGAFGDVWTFAISPAVFDSAEVLTLDYGGSSTQSATNQLLAPFTGFPVTNNMPPATVARRRAGSPRTGTRTAIYG
jgi:hypothetical protein